MVGLGSNAENIPILFIQLPGGITQLTTDWEVYSARSADSFVRTQYYKALKYNSDLSHIPKPAGTPIWE